MYARLMAFLALAGAPVFMGTANAAPITFQFSGVITQVPIDGIFGDIFAGDLFFGSYTFDSAAADAIPADPATGSYTSAGAPFGMTVMIGVHVFSTSNLLNIGIMNGLVDQYTVLALSAGGDLTLELFLQDNTAGVFANDGLPLSAPSLASFTLMDFRLSQTFETGEVQVDGRIDALTTVPEPATGALSCGVLLLLALAHYRRSSRFD